MKLIRSVLLILALLLLTCGCQPSAPAGEASTEAEKVTVPAAVRHYDHMVYELFMHQSVYTTSDSVFTVAIRGIQPGWFCIGERWRLSLVSADGSTELLGECPYETGIELDPAEGAEYVDSILIVGLDMLGIDQPLVPGTYLLQYLGGVPGEDGGYVTEPLYSLYFIVTE